MQALPGAVHRTWGRGGAGVSAGAGPDAGPGAGHRPHRSAAGHRTAGWHQGFHRFEAAFQPAAVINGEHRPIYYEPGEQHPSARRRQDLHPLPCGEVQPPVAREPALRRRIEFPQAFRLRVQRPAPWRHIPGGRGTRIRLADPCPGGACGGQYSYRQHRGEQQDSHRPD